MIPRPQQAPRASDRHVPRQKEFEDVSSRERKYQAAIIKKIGVEPVAAQSIRPKFLASRIRGNCARVLAHLFQEMAPDCLDVRAHRLRRGTRIVARNRLDDGMVLRIGDALARRRHGGAPIAAPVVAAP